MRTIITLILLFSFTVTAEEHKHDFAQDVAAFHHVLSPLWHAEANAKRQTETCSALPNMLNIAEKMTYPSAKKLSQSVRDLQKACTAEIKTFNTLFGQLHDTFHQVSEEK
jgi:hypothetical protein